MEERWSCSLALPFTNDKTATIYLITTVPANFMYHFNSIQDLISACYKSSMLLISGSRFHIAASLPTYVMFNPGLKKLFYGNNWLW